MGRSRPTTTGLVPDAGQLDRRAIRTLLRPRGPLDTLPGPVLLLDADGRLIEANDAGARLHDAKREALAITIAEAKPEMGEGEGEREAIQFKLHDPSSSATADLAAVPVDGGRCWLVIGHDISLDHDLRNALVDSRQRYKDIIEISGDFGWETDGEGRFVFLSNDHVLGYDSHDLIGIEASSLLSPGAAHDTVSPFSTRETIDDVEIRLRRRDGSTADVVVAAAPLTDDTGLVRGARGLARDVTEERAREAALARARNRERLMSYVVGAMHDEIDPSTMLGVAARAIARALATESCLICRKGEDRWAREAVAGTEITDEVLRSAVLKIPPEPREETIGQYRVVTAATRWRQTVNGAVVLTRPSHHPWTADEISLAGAVAGQIGIALAQVAAHERLEWLSTRDPLTGLLNRRTFVDRLSDRIAPKAGGGRNRAEDERPGVLAYVDLDNFKSVNDRLGHQAGDEALLEVSAMLTDAVRRGDLVARLGGDEFALWLDGASEIVARDRAERLLAKVKALDRFSTKGAPPLGFSIGMAIWRPGSNEALDDLISRADHAMYQVKRAGKGRVAISSKVSDVTMTAPAPPLAPGEPTGSRPGDGNGR